MEVSLAASPAVSLTAFKAFPSRRPGREFPVGSFGMVAWIATRPHRRRGVDRREGNRVYSSREAMCRLVKRNFFERSVEAEGEGDGALARVLHLEHHGRGGTAIQPVFTDTGIADIVPGFKPT